MKTQTIDIPAGGEIIIRLQASAAPAEADAPIPITAEGLASFGLEERPIRRLAASGALRTVRIGRRVFTTRRALAELADKLPAATAPKSQPEAPVDELDAAVRAKAARKARA